MDEFEEYGDDGDADAGFGGGDDDYETAVSKEAAAISIQKRLRGQRARESAKHVTKPVTAAAPTAGSPAEAAPAAPASPTPTPPRRSPAKKAPSTQGAAAARAAASPLAQPSGPPSRKAATELPPSPSAPALSPSHRSPASDASSRSSQSLRKPAVPEAQRRVGKAHAQSRVNARAIDQLNAEQQEQWRLAFVSEWLTQHPPALRYPQHIWLHADCPPPAEEEGGAEGGASSLRGRVHTANKRTISLLQSGQMDEALLALKELEANVRKNFSPKERNELLPVTMNNLAYYYYRRGKFASASAYMGKAVQMERHAYGAVDFATHLRLAAVASRMKQHVESLKHCRAALRVLQHGADEAGEGADEGAAAAFHAHLAVAYHNTAVQLAHTQQLQEASASAKLAHDLVTNVLPAKHRWVKLIAQTARLLSDMHVSTAFVEHSLRPQLGASASAAAM